MIDTHYSRRDFIRMSGMLSGGFFLGSNILGIPKKWMSMGSALKISLAEWSLHRTLESGELTNLDFAATANSFGINGIEYVSRFFNGGETDGSYLEQLNKNALDNNVRQLLIMIDGEGSLADKDKKSRHGAVKKHHKWVIAAHELGCHSIRVNAHGEGSAQEMHEQAVDGLSRLAEFGAKHNINVIVENHGDLSSNASWLMGVIDEVNMANCGTLPDFGNFCIKRNTGEMYNGDCVEEYDRYKGVEEMLPKATAVSAKSYNFDADGNETLIDFEKMIELVRASGYSGYIGIEYEGNVLSEADGIRATKKLLERYI